MANNCAIEVGTEGTAATSPAARGMLPTDSVARASTPLFAEYLRRGAKPIAEWRCGVELELFGYDARTLARLDAAQVQIVLSGFAESPDDLVFEGATIIESSAGRAGRVTIEPGGQIEFSGAPQQTLVEVERGIKPFISRLGEIAVESDFIFLAAGFDPLRTIDEQQWFPKMRYAVMRPYLATRGARAWDMMCRTAAIQVSLDYGSEEDLAKKFALGNRLAPIITAMFANSPFADGKLSGYKSTRAAAWLETDADRAGLAPSAITNNFSLDSFVEDALQVPMLFVRRDGHYLDAPTGMPFGKFLEEGCGYLRPVFDDWLDHLTTLFTDARLRQHIELRSADCGALPSTLALQALWKGLMYDDAALDAALAIAPVINREGAARLREEVARHGLSARHESINVLDVAKEILMIAAAGLRRIAPDEVPYLDVLRQQVIEDDVCPADILLRNWHGGWHTSMSKVVEYLRAA
ncbi:MAG: glutamate--cysteine ligase [Pyrinomonadaceae bacterium]